MKVPKYLYDFYCVAAKFDRTQITKQQETILKLFLVDVKQQLLKDVQYCVYRELRHSPCMCDSRNGEFGYYFTGVRYDSSGIFPELEITSNGMYWWSAPTRKGLKRTLKKSEKTFFRKSRKMFLGGGWGSDYGGKKWAKICQIAILLEKDSFQDLGNSIVLIDRLIDAAHNTGRCLDKIYPKINKFLDRKTKAKDPTWIIRKSSRQIRHIFR